MEVTLTYQMAISNLQIVCFILFIYYFILFILFICYFMTLIASILAALYWLWNEKIYTKIKFKVNILK